MRNLFQRIKNLLNRIKQGAIYIIGPKKSIPQILEELVRDIDKETYSKKGLPKCPNPPLGSLKLVWDKEKVKKK